jgi:hypothetical protein
VDVADLSWRTSSFSGGNGNSCVEVAPLSDGGVAVRDTKDRSRAPHQYSATAWQAFVAGVRGRDLGNVRGGVEMSRLPDGGVALRPAADRTCEPHVYTAAEWAAFVKGVDAGEFDFAR